MQSLQSQSVFAGCNKQGGNGFIKRRPTCNSQQSNQSKSEQI